MPIKTTTVLETEFGTFAVNCHKIGGHEYISLVCNEAPEQIPVIRLHSACLFGEAFHSLHCDCEQQLTHAMKMIHDHGCGVIVYSYRQEGRGIGLEKKIAAMEIERTRGCDTGEAFKLMGYDNPDQRDYQAEIEVLKELKVPHRVRLFTGNPNKRNALEKARYEI